MSSFTDIISRRADAYHTCYTLAGLSSAQHYNRFTGLCKSGSSLDYALQWVSLPKMSMDDVNIKEEDRVMAIHPIYAIPWADVDQAHDWFCNKRGF